MPRLRPPAVRPYNFAMHPQAGPAFASTHWSIVLAAADRASPHSEAALASLCTSYWRPLYAYARRRGHSIEDAQDLTQSFFSHLLEKDSLRRVDPALGKFRAFLLASMKNFLANEWRREQSARRGGGARFVSVEELTGAERHFAATLASSGTPDRVYERNWALALLERATSRLAAEFDAAGKAAFFQTLKPYLTGDPDAPYAAAAAALGISEVSARVAVHRMRGRFRDLVVREAAQTLPDPGDTSAIDEELRYLRSVL
jgi:RNA polymerase sigma factor (sigma-70 family)